MRKSILVALVAALAGLTASAARAGATFTVTNTNDSGPGSLRQAILDANASPGKDTIAFALPGPGLIFPATELPVVTDPVVIDGTTQSGYTGTPLVVLFGGLDPSAGSLAYGLDIQAGQSTVSALAIGGFGVGIKIERASNDTVVRSTIGTNPSGTNALPNIEGIEILGGSKNTIGGSSLGAGNVISGNSDDGVLIQNDSASGSTTSTGNAIQGNSIGTNGDGTAALGNGRNGVELDGVSKNLVGGSLLLGAGNVISGQNSLLGEGVDIEGGGDNQISSNLIGTSADGMSAIPNADGILIRRSSGNLIGRATGPHSIRGGGNVISGNLFQGINDLVDSGDQITGNVIGRTADNAAPLGNQYGLYIADDATGTIGTERDPNVIADNTLDGIVVVNTSYGVQISANSIFDNGLVTVTNGPEPIGIDLNGDGVTLNDPGDSDTGPNGLQNFPVITSVTHQGGQLVIGGTLNSRPFGTYRLEFFANTSCDPSGYGQGESYLGSKTVVADAFGNVTFSAKLHLAPSAATPIVTSTATDASGNTSEFSACATGG